MNTTRTSGYKISLILAILIHAALLWGFFLNASMTRYRLPAPAQDLKSAVPVHAVAINAMQIAEQVQVIQSRENRERMQEEERQRQLQEEMEAARHAREQEEQRLVQLQKEREEAQKQRDEAAQKAQEEQGRLAKFKAEHERQIAEAKMLVEKKAAAAKMQAAAEKKRQTKEAAIKRKHELAARQQNLQQQLLEQQIANEQKDLIKTQQMQGVINEYRAKILSAIGNKWLIPDQTDPTISCVFTIDLTSDGKVFQVSLVNSSGNKALDRAAEAAIYKASPLPVPKDPMQFKPFRHFTLKMTPQDVMN